MARQIKFHFLHSLFRLFAYLADKSGGWRVFVKPKIVLGGLIIGLGVTACQSNDGHQSSEKTDSAKVKVNARLSESANLLHHKSTQLLAEETKNEKIITKTTCYFQIPENVTTKQYVNAVKGEIVTDSTVYTIAEIPPQFTDGDVNAYVAKNIRYPVISTCYVGIQGRVICQFIVEKDGSVSNVHVVRSVDPEIDKEAIRVISSMPKWIPGEQNGKKVRVLYTLPVSFRLQ